MRTHRMPSLLLGLCASLSMGAPASADDDVPQAQNLNTPLITLQLVDADVRDALRLMSQQSGVDIVLSNSVSGKVTLELANKTLTESLEAIAGVSGLQYSAKDSIVTVTTLDELLDQMRKRDELSGGAAGAGVLSEPEPGLAMRLFRLSYVDAERVIDLLRPLMSEQGKLSLLKSPDQHAQAVAELSVGGGAMADLQIGGRLSTSSQGRPAMSHTLVVSDLPERLERIAEIITAVDVRPMQLLIEARFVEVVLGKDDKLGIDWNMAVSGRGGSAPTTFPFGDSSLGSYDPNVVGGSPNGGVFPGAPADVSTPGVPGLFTFGTLDFTAFTAVLQLIQDDSRVQVVSNPRVLVSDRTTATILVGERYPILSSTITDQGTVTEALDHYEPIGVQLEVTPSVLDDEQVELIVRPSTSSLGQDVEGSTGIAIARINTRQIDTSVTALDRQTVVLGGLISSRATESESRVPWLSDIPLLGWLFTSQSTKVEKVDLVVFLTVTMMKDQGLTANEQRMFDRTIIRPAGESEDELAHGFSVLDYTPSPAQY